MCTKVDLQLIVHCNLITWSTNSIKRTTGMNDHTDLSSCWKSRHNYTLQNCPYTEKLMKNSTWNKNKLGTTCVCCSSIFTFGTKFFEPVQNFLNQFKFFEPVQIFQPKSICWFFCFCGKQKNLFGTFDLLFIPLLLFISTLLTWHLLFPPCSPNIPAPILFISMLTCTMWALNHLPLVFLWIHVLMPYHWAMETWMQVPLFF